MCGRYVVRTTHTGLFAEADSRVVAPMDFSRFVSFNIVPSESIAIVRVNPATGEREVAAVRWGLVPSWAKDLKIGAKMINARAESVFVKPSFRTAVRKRRCLVVADGFYEWKRDVTPSVPWYFSMKDGQPFGIAGIWETWNDAAGKPVESAAMITVEANVLMANVHHRMPVIVRPEDYALWLDPAQQDTAKLAPLLKPFAAEAMDAWPVSRAVNLPANDAPRLIEPAATSGEDRPGD